MESERKEVLAFLTQIGFIAPTGMSNDDFVGMSDQDIMLDSVDNDASANIKSLFDNDRMHNGDHPDPYTFADYYMFNDPSADDGLGDQNDPNAVITQDYQKKDLSQTHSFSDVHIEEIQQDAGAWPKHNGVKSEREY